MKQVLRNWEKATQELTDYFLKQYFAEEDYEPDWYWIADLIGETLFVNDYFFNLDRIVEAIRYKPTYKQLIDFYELELDFATKEKPMEINFYHYLKQIK